jgi:Na+/H+-dicarboxylate symporter
MTRSDKEKYQNMALGLVGGVLLGAFLPDKWNPVTIVKDQFGGLV